MTAEAPSKREQQREERRRQILGAALTVFSQKGFHAANVSDVAAEAGVSQGTIYWYFESKEELLTAALLWYFVDFGEEALAAIEKCETASEKLRALGRSMEGFARESEGLFTLFVSWWASSERRDEAGQVWVDLLVQYKDVVVGLIDKGIESGEFAPVDAEQLAWAMMAAYDGLAAYGMLVSDLDLARSSQSFIEVILRGLRFAE